jgi:hypothetical protein
MADLQDNEEEDGVLSIPTDNENAPAHDHDNLRYTCETCPKRFQFRCQALACSHWDRASITGILSKDCVLCNESFITYKLLEHHYSAVHTGEERIWLRKKKNLPKGIPETCSHPPINTRDDLLLYFALDTTGSINSANYPDICNLALSNRNEFEIIWTSYLIPNLPILWAGSMNHFITNDINEDNQPILRKRGVIVSDAKEYFQGLNEFYKCLLQVSSTHLSLFENGKIILAAHDCRAFSSLVLMAALKQINVSPEDLESHNIWFLDTIEIINEMEKLIPNLFANDKSLKSAYENVFGEDLRLDDASERVKGLHRILSYPEFPFDEAVKNTFIFLPSEVKLKEAKINSSASQ